MSLSLNPLSQLVTKISSSLSSAANSVQTKLTNTTPGNAIDKANLDKLISDRGGGGFINGGYGSIGSGNGDLKGLASAATSKVSSIAGTLQNAAAGVSNQFSDLNRLSGSINKLTGGNLAGTIQNLSAKISGFAGQANNLLSVIRGKDIPKGAELLVSQGSATQISPNNESDWRVRIRLASDNAYDEVLGGGPLLEVIQSRGGVVWPYLPNITLTTKANYNTVESIHSNYPFYAYKNSSVEDITIAGEFSVENQRDAQYWVAATLFLRSVTKMFFGQGPNAGNPPPICVFDGYGGSLFKNVPVVVKSFSVDLKDDVNYIYYDETKTWVPIMSTITVIVAPIYNRARLRGFDLRSYSSGRMITGENVGYL